MEKSDTLTCLFGSKAFNDNAAAMYDKEDEIVNFFVNRSTNAAAESLNTKIKHKNSFSFSYVRRKKAVE